MGFFDSESRLHKNKLVELQNIVLAINEKKLQVSEDFLEKMTKIYISKYMKVVNEHIADIGSVTGIGLLYRKYDIIMANLNELIKIEPYYSKFTRPIPSEYKAQLENSFEEFINAMISREWRKIKPMNGAVREDPMQETKCRAFFDSFASYEHRMPEASVTLLRQLHNSVFPPEKPKNEIPALNDNIPEESPEFVPEEFERIDSEGTAATEQAEA